MTDSTTAKPPFPTDPWSPWPRIPVDEISGSDFDEICRAATFAADGLMLSPAVISSSATQADRTAAAVREALLYLLEMGLVDIDTERLETFLNTPHPLHREGRR